MCIHVHQKTHMSVHSTTINKSPKWKQVSMDRRKDKLIVVYPHDDTSAQ